MLSIHLPKCRASDNWSSPKGELPPAAAAGPIPSDWDIHMAFIRKYLSAFIKKWFVCHGGRIQPFENDGLWVRPIACGSIFLIKVIFSLTFHFYIYNFLILINYSILINHRTWLQCRSCSPDNDISPCRSALRIIFKNRINFNFRNSLLYFRRHKALTLLWLPVYIHPERMGRFSAWRCTFDLFENDCDWGMVVMHQSGHWSSHWGVLSWK